MRGDSVNCLCSRVPAVIHAWARSSEKKRARNAYNLLNVMTRRWYDRANNDPNAGPDKTVKKKQNYNHMKPNVKSSTAVLNACARPIDAKERADAFAIAQLTMAELSVGTYGKPNFLSFAAYLSVCATTLDIGPERDAAVQTAFEACVDAGEVGQIVLEKLHSAASPALLERLIGGYRNQHGHIVIPNNWNSNIRGERFGATTVMKSMKATEGDLGNISKSSQRRLEAVQNGVGTPGIFFENGIDVAPGGISVREDEDGISWSSKDGFSSR